MQPRTGIGTYPPMLVIYDSPRLSRDICLHHTGASIVSSDRLEDLFTHSVDRFYRCCATFQKKTLNVGARAPRSGKTAKFSGHETVMQCAKSAKSKTVGSIRGMASVKTIFGISKSHSKVGFFWKLHCDDGESGVLYRREGVKGRLFACYWKYMGIRENSAARKIFTTTESQQRTIKDKQSEINNQK